VSMRVHVCMCMFACVHACVCVRAFLCAWLCEKFTVQIQQCMSL